MPQDGEMQTLQLKAGQWNIKKEFINISMADPVWIRHLLPYSLTVTNEASVIPSGNVNALGVVLLTTISLLQ